MVLQTSDTAGLTATPTLDASQDAGGKGQALAVAITAPLGEKKLYLQETGHTKASKLSFQVKLSQEAFDAGFTGGKLYAKTGDGWTWSNGDWVSINPDTWTTVTLDPWHRQRRSGGYQGTRPAVCGGAASYDVREDKGLCRQHSD